MKVYCPYCRKEVEYKVEKREVNEFKGIVVNTFEEVAICNECDNDLYVNEIENKNNERIYEIYREKANIVKPDDIINLRKKYDISQRELTAILGFGKMTINRYERGGVPTKSQSDYIKLLIDNEIEFIKKTEEAFKNNVITKKTYEKIVSNKSNSSDKKLRDFLENLIEINLYRKPDIYNGYQKFDIEKVENIISYIASKVDNLTITSLNKYLWYIDMLAFNMNCKSITGLTYEHEKYGPTIINKGYNYISLLDEKYKKEDYENEYGTTTKIQSNKNYDLSCFSDNEIEIIDQIIDLFKDKNVTDISNMSHKEDGWKKTKRFEKISFEYAMNLNIIK